MNSRLITATLIATAGLASVLASQTASAAFANGRQTTRFVGASCHPTNAANAAHAQIDSHGRIFNTSPTQVLAVNCPVQRDPFEAKASQVSVYAIDQKAHLGSALTCTFSMVNPINGQPNSSSLFGTKDLPSTTSKTELIESTTLSGINHSNLSCFIPAADPSGNKQSGIAAYFVVETGF